MASIPFPIMLLIHPCSLMTQIVRVMIISMQILITLQQICLAPYAGSANL